MIAAKNTLNKKPTLTKSAKNSTKNSGTVKHHIDSEIGSDQGLYIYLCYFHVIMYKWYFMVYNVAKGRKGVGGRKG